jgi:antitoxin component of MazEF toxin-antitoxin module
MSVATIQRWGNSNALRIPAATMKAWGMKEGESVELHVQGTQLVAQPARKHYSLDELLAQCTPANMARTDEDRAWLSGAHVGKEAL